jgi:hypothetical protein
MDVEAFEKGYSALEAKDYKAAERGFSEAMKSINENHDRYNRLASFLGLAQVLTANRNGLLLCRDAASSEALEGDVFLNLACAEWHAENRERAVDAIIRGRKIDADHEQLVKACMLLDSRRRVFFPFLEREHLLNQLLGRIMRRPQVEITVHHLMF